MALAPAAQSIITTRHDQMFPTLEASEIERMRRFGEVCFYAKGDALARVGAVSRGFTIILSGHVDITQHDESGKLTLIVTHGPGQFMGELAQLAGRPALVDATATEPVEALIIRPEKLRALLIGEAELGEKIMRALILRRVGLIETGAGGPVIVGRPGNGDVLRLEGFLRRNGHPSQSLDPETDAEAKALIERFHVDPSQLPIVLCPGGQLLRNPSEMELARCIGMVDGGRSEPASTTSRSSARGRRGLRPRSMRRRKGCRSLCSIAARSADRPARRRGSRTISASRPASPAWR